MILYDYYTNVIKVWRRLQVNVKHNELLKLFNCDMRFIILQHSPNK